MIISSMSSISELTRAVQPSKCLTKVQEAIKAAGGRVLDSDLCSNSFDKTTILT